MSGILIKISSPDYSSERFRWYEIFANRSDIPDDSDVEGSAEFNAVSQDNYFPHVGLTPGDQWYHWVRVAFDDGTTKSGFAKFGPDTAPGNGSIAVSDISDATTDAKSLLKAADFAAMRILLSLGTAALVALTTDGSLAGNSDGNVPSEKAVRSYVASAVSALVASAPSALDTLNELATALGDDASFATTVSTALGNRVRVDAAQGLTSGQKTQARANIGAVIGTDVQAHGAGLDAIAGLTFAANKVLGLDASAAPAMFPSQRSSWSPALSGSTTAGTVSYSAQQGSIWRYRDLVVATFYINASSISGMAGNLQLSGLPLAATATTELGAMMVTYFDGFTLPSGGTFLGGDVLTSASTARFLVSGSGASTGLLPVTAVVGTANVRGVLIYRTDAP